MLHEERQLITITKNAGLGIFGKIFSSIITFCMVVLITRTIGPEQYGIYVLAITIGALIRALGLIGFEPAMVKFVSQYKAQKNTSLVKGVIGFGFKVSFVTSFILSIVVFLSAEFVAKILFHKPDLTSVLRVIILAVPFFACVQILLAALQGAKLIKYKILVQQILMVTFRFISIAIAFWFGFRLMAVAWVLVITAIFGFCVALIILTKRMGWPFKAALIGERKNVLKFSLPLLLSGLFYQNINIIGILVIGAFLPAADAGIYGVAGRIIPVILIPLISYNAIFSPIISELFTKGKMKELESIFKTGSKWVMMMTLPLFMLIVLFSHEIVNIFGQGFSNSAQVMIILLIGQIVNAGTGSTGFMLSMTGKTLFNLFNSGALCGLNIALALFMVGRFGVVGVAWAYTLSIIVIQLLQMSEVWYFYRIHPYRLEHIKPILGCLISSCILLYMRRFFPVTNNLVVITICVLTFLVSYGIFLKIAGLSDSDRMILNKIRQGIFDKLILPRSNGQKPIL